MAPKQDSIIHLRAGSTQPKFDNGYLTVYSLRFSPFSERVRLLLNYKQIPFNIVNIHIRDRPEWYYKKNPLGKVPCLEEPDGSIVYESLVVAEYIEDRYHDQRPLLPADPYQRAVQKQLIELVIGTASYNHTVLEGNPDAKKTVEGGLDKVEELLQTDYWSGGECGFVDLMVWPWFERLPAIQRIAAIRFSPEHHPKILAWMDRMLTIPAVKMTAYDTEERLAFLESRKAGAINFDVGLQS
ncbi:hypothetical protein RvY_13901 [Ramazzottius varieornatus]|uniref:Glutathione S-transferase omega n=1 Tax=Ramazzottius varieornatus TaxID=947166 RepID=A0A1D1VWW2_RAMVA|nr:hypothetical protein RvY_13901 [Ramazzottius varieornatus]